MWRDFQKVVEAVDRRTVWARGGGPLVWAHGLGCGQLLCACGIFRRRCDEGRCLFHRMVARSLSGQSGVLQPSSTHLGSRGDGQCRVLGYTARNRRACKARVGSGCCDGNVMLLLKSSRWPVVVDHSFSTSHGTSHAANPTEGRARPTSSCPRRRAEGKEAPAVAAGLSATAERLRFN